MLYPRHLQVSSIQQAELPQNATKKRAGHAAFIDDRIGPLTLSPERAGNASQSFLFELFRIFRILKVRFNGLKFRPVASLPNFGDSSKLSPPLDG